MIFKDKVVIVTGAGKGIGRCIAENYAIHGAKVIIAEKEIDQGQHSAKKIVLKGGRAEFVRTDVAINEDIINLINMVASKYKRLDILINNAGISGHFSPYDLPIAEWDEIINVNLRGVFLCSRQASRIMKENGEGAIVNIASTRAFMSEPNTEAYAASKGGIIALTHALAASLSKDHIIVNCISPGWIETGDYEDLRPIDHDQHFSGRVGKPQDIADACLYLTKPGNNFINGTNLIIDGGMTRKMIYEP